MCVRVREKVWTGGSTCDQDGGESGERGGSEKGDLPFVFKEGIFGVFVVMQGLDFLVCVFWDVVFEVCGKVSRIWQK